MVLGKLTLSVAVLLAATLLSPSQGWSLNVYVLSSGYDPADQAILNALVARGHTPTLGVQHFQWDGTQADLTTFQVVVFLNSYNTLVSDGMPASGQNALISYISNGGGMVTGEFAIKNINYSGPNAGLNPIVPAVVTWVFCCNNTTTYSQVTADPILNNGVPTSFTFNERIIGGVGSESRLIPKAGATIFYSSSASGGPNGLIGWNYNAGRVISFSTLLTEIELAQANYAQLFVNAVEWAGPVLPVGGSVTGVRPTTVDCQNLTTGQTVSISLGPNSWNCTNAGLVVNSGDTIVQTVTGTVP